MSIETISTSEEIDFASFFNSIESFLLIFFDKIKVVSTYPQPKTSPSDSPSTIKGLEYKAGKLQQDTIPLIDACQESIPCLIRKLETKPSFFEYLKSNE